ncbi:hypothetical protein KAR91_84720 [Candidatus Pacearchaeota archaeon]|nr:hypothetical protein [Candidatus Pacearchaeota archaeon]
MNNRSCWYRYDILKEWISGTFIEFGIDWKDFGAGPVQYTVAIILDNKTQKIVYVHADNNISFASIP